MDKEIEDGGPAFPTRGSMLEVSQRGQSLRDYFAAKALQGDWASQGEQTGEFTNDVADHYLEIRAGLYYRMADAMLRAREEA
jgi:hypothetical protein